MNSKVLNNYGSFDVTFKKGKGATLTDIYGKKYIDFLAGIAVNCLGHNYGPLVRTIKKQAKKQIHICNYFTSDVGIEYANELLAQTQFEGVYFGNSGAEANEAAIKLARKYGYETGGKNKKTIVTLQKSFHGRTLATLTATGQDVFHPECFAPYAEGFKTIVANDYASLENAFDENTCALMMECVQGEGGVIPLDKEWAKKACELAHKNGAIVIADEVQTGIGRTGSFLASKLLDLDVDVVTLAKGIAGGVPMGACLYRGKANVFKAGDHQSTFGGNPLACSAALLVLNTVNDEQFLANVKFKGEYIRNQIAKWNLPCIKEIRGVGLMIGIEVNVNPVEVEKKCLSKGLLFSTAGSNTLRLVPPLNINWNEIDKGLSILHEVLSSY